MSRENLRAVALGVQTGVPIHAEGMPGDAKTSWAKGLGGALGIPTVILTPSIYEPTDIGGYVAISYTIEPQNESWAAIPRGASLTGQWWATLLSEHPGLLVVDEIKTLSRSLQAVSLRLIFELRAGDTQLHPDTLVLALSNPADMSPDGRELAAPLANRFCHLDWDMPLDTWGQAGMQASWQDGGRPVFKQPTIPVADPSWRKKIPAQFAQVFAFSKARPSLMRVVPKDISKQGGAWPSLRTWTYVAQMLAISDHDEEVCAALLTGCVGTGPAMEYLGWKQALDLPDFAELLIHPKQLKLPKEGDRQFAVLLGVVGEVARNLSDQTWVQGWEVLHYGTTQAPKDVVTVAAKSLAALRESKPTLPFPSKKLMEPFMEVLRSVGIRLD